MRLRFTRFLIVAALFALIPVLAPSPTVLAAQAPAAMPRTSDGKPDLSGFWQALNTANIDIQDHQAHPDAPAGQGVVVGNEIPYTPAALKQKQQNAANRAADTEAKCFLPGVPRVMYMPFPFQIVQLPDAVTMLFEYDHATRAIYTNGTKHPEGEIDWWMGDSRGRWEGDTLVVDSIHFNNETWFDRAGNHHSEKLHLVERFTLMDRDHINYEVTVEDPAVFTRPWKMQMVLYRHVERYFQLLEYECYAFDLEKYYPYPEVLSR